MTKVDTQEQNNTDLAFKASPFVLVVSCFIIALLWLPDNILANYPWLDRQLHLIDALHVVVTLSLSVSLIVTLFSQGIGKFIFMSSSTLALILASGIFIKFDLELINSSIAIMAFASVVTAFRYYRIL